MNEINKEGIAVDLENAIASFKAQIDPKARTTSRLFAQELQNKDLKFLDIGCGIGRHLLVLKNNHIRNAIGFDIVYQLAEIGRRELGLEDLFVANAARLPLPDSSIDRALMYNVIEHCSQPEQVFSEVYRVLSWEGLLYMDAPNAHSMGDRLFRWGGKIVYGKTSHIQKFTLRRIEHMLDLTGFHVLQRVVQKGIYLDYPQLKKLSILKKILRLMFNREVLGWELQLGKKR